MLTLAVTKGIQAFLEESGEDVIILIKLGIRHLHNGAVLLKAKELNRILLTYDKGFLLFRQNIIPQVSNKKVLHLRLRRRN